MARPQQDAIETFKAITGASDDVALVKLEEHRGDLNAAINAHFSEADRRNMQDYPLPNAHNDFMDLDNIPDVNSQVHPFLASRITDSLTPSDSVFSLRGSSARSSRNNGAPRVSHPREVREIPIEFKDGNEQSSRLNPTIEDVTDIITEHGHSIQGTVVIDDDEDDASLSNRAARNVRNNDGFYLNSAPSAPHVNSAIYVDDDIEEEMVKAAIEASKKETTLPKENELMPTDDPSFIQEVGDERLLNDGSVPFGHSLPSGFAGTSLSGMERTWTTNGRQEPGNFNGETSSRSRSEDDDDAEYLEEQPSTRHRSSERHGSAIGDGQSTNRPSSGPGLDDENHPHLNGAAFPDEWGGISSEERDEAVMLEAAMFGGVPESSTFPFAYSAQSLSDRNAGFHARIPRSPSPTLVAQRILREQQDDEYLASLAVDREKELKAMQEAEHRRSEEEAAKEAALQQERHQIEEEKKKQLEEEEYERQLALKQALLPHEPAVDDENAVTLLVRMPDGSRQGRRFFKSDKLHCLFDFIDAGRVVKSNTYRLVRSYPRRAFGESEKRLSFGELGLTNKQEALFIELIQ